MNVCVYSTSSHNITLSRENFGRHTNHHTRSNISHNVGIPTLSNGMYEPVFDANISL